MEEVQILGKNVNKAPFQYIVRKQREKVLHRTQTKQFRKLRSTYVCTTILFLSNFWNQHILYQNFLKFKIYSIYATFQLTL